MASIKEQLDKILIEKVKLKNGKTVKENLVEAVDYLYRCIQARIDAMYESYEPIKYKRRPVSEGLRSSLYAEDFLESRIVGNTVQLSLRFNSNVWAWNFNHTHMSPVNVLMNQGWHSKKLEDWIGHPVERLTYFEGEHFIENGIADFNRNNKWGVTIMWDIDSSRWY